MARSDYAWVNFDENFTSNNPQSTRTFSVEGAPIGNAYLLIQAAGIQSSSHRIQINAVDLPSFDLVPQADWRLWMDRIPPGMLHAGQNRITIIRVGNDDFNIANVVVHWRENG